MTLMGLRLNKIFAHNLWNFQILGFLKKGLDNPTRWRQNTWQGLGIPGRQLAPADASEPFVLSLPRLRKMLQPPSFHLAPDAVQLSPDSLKSTIGLPRPD